MSTSSQSPQIFSKMLPNGLTVVGELHPHSRSAAIGYFVKTGARDETKPESGVSHFLEHMLFKGTERLDALALSRELADLGVQANAYTSEENTVYYGAVLREHLSAYHTLLSEMMRPSLDENEFAMEKNVILEEIALYQDRPSFYLMERAFLDYFAGHPAGNSVLGAAESIRALTRAQMHQYYLRRYTPQNMVFAIAGSFDWQEVLDRTEELSSAWPVVTIDRSVTPYSRAPSKHTFVKPNLEQAHLLLVREGCSLEDPDRYALDLLTQLIGDSGNSPLHWQITHTGLAEEASLDTDERNGTGLIYGYAVTSPDKLDAVVGKMNEVLATKYKWTSADLGPAQRKLAARIVLSGEVPMSRLMAIGTDMAAHGEAISLAEEIRRINAVTLADLERVAERFPLSDWCEYRLLPE